MLKQTEVEQIFSGLRALAESAFPKRCSNCGREYVSAAEFIAATQALRPDCSGLKHSLDDDDKPIVDLFRNCACGSTLMQSFSDRRDYSEAGMKRRQYFDQTLGDLVTQGVAREIAYVELLKFMRGEPHELLHLANHLPEVGDTDAR